MGYDWPSLEALDGAELENHYNATLRVLAREPGLLGLSFRKSQNRFRDPAKLRRIIVDLIGPSAGRPSTLTSRATSSARS